MKKLLLSAVLLGLIALPSVRADEKEDAAIHKRSDEWSAAWNKHDPHLMASFWLPDGDLIDPFGKSAKGPEAIEAFFAAEHTGNGMMVGTTYAGTITNIRYIGKNAVVVDIDAEVSGFKGPDGAAMPSLKHHITWVAEKKDGKWMALAARPSIPATPPGAPASAAPAPAK